MPEDTYKFLIAGVGGQGTVLASDILAEVGIRLGYDTKKSDILGLAVRGGSVVSHIQWAPRVYSPVLDEHDVDYLIGFEWLETLRRLSYVKPDGLVLANDCRIDPMTVTSGQAELAINCCGSGTGASISAGKFRGVCAVSCESEQTARLARIVNDANCLCMGESIVSPELGCRMVEAFVNARFQDAPDVPEPVLEFWREARDELMARGAESADRELEFLKMP